MSADVVAAVASLLSAVVNVAFIILLIVQLKIFRDQVGDARKVYVSEQDRIKRQATLEQYSGTSEYRHALKIGMPTETDEYAVKKVIKEAQADKAKKRELYNYLNYYENIAAGVNCGIYDIEIVARTSGTILIRVLEAYWPFICEDRTTNGFAVTYTELQLLRPKLLKELAKLSKTMANALSSDELDLIHNAPPGTVTLST